MFLAFLFQLTRSRTKRAVNNLRAAAACTHTKLHRKKEALLPTGTLYSCFALAADLKCNAIKPPNRHQPPATSRHASRVLQIAECAVGAPARSTTENKGDMKEARQSGDNVNEQRGKDPKKQRRQIRWRSPFLSFLSLVAAGAAMSRYYSLIYFFIPRSTFPPVTRGPPQWPQGPPRRRRRPCARPRPPARC